MRCVCLLISESRIKVPDPLSDFDVMCFHKELEKRRVARIKAPVAEADRRTELMWKEYKWMLLTLSLSKIFSVLYRKDI